jgi:hypothetical protein
MITEWIVALLVMACFWGYIEYVVWAKKKARK